MLSIKSNLAFLLFLNFGFCMKSMQNDQFSPSYLYAIGVYSDSDENTGSGDEFNPDQDSDEDSDYEGCRYEEGRLSVSHPEHNRKFQEEIETAIEIEIETETETELEIETETETELEIEAEAELENSSCMNFSQDIYSNEIGFQLDYTSQNVREQNKKYPELTGLNFKLFDLVKKGDINNLNCLLNQIDDIDIVNELDETALLVAAKYDQLSCLKKLVLCFGADVNACSKTKFTPLMAAAENNNVDAVKFLLDKGADSQVRDIFDTTALDRAKNFEAKEVIEILEKIIICHNNSTDLSTPNEPNNCTKITDNNNSDYLETFNCNQCCFTTKEQHEFKKRENQCYRMINVSKKIQKNRKFLRNLSSSKVLKNTGYFDCCFCEYASRWLCNLRRHVKKYHKGQEYEIEI